MGPSPGGGCVGKGGHFGVIKGTILSPQGLPLTSLRAQFVASGGDKFTPSVLCRPEVCHYTPKNSPASLRRLADLALAKRPGTSKNGQFVLSHSSVSHIWKYPASVLNIPASYSHGRSDRASDHCV